MTPELLVVISILACAAGAVVTALVSRRPRIAGGLALLTAVATAGLVGWAVVHVVLSGPSPEPAAFLVIPWLGFAPRFHVDGLSSVFLGLAATLAVPATLHSIGYLRARHPGRGTREYYPCLLLFLSAMYGLTSTTDMMWFFLFFWQLMTLPGYFLIRFEGGMGPARAAPDNPYDFAAVSAALPRVLSEYPLPAAGAG